MSRTKKHREQALAKRKLVPWPRPPKHKTHGSPISKCNCALCQDGLRRGFGNVVAKRASRSFRRKAKSELRQGKEPAKNFGLAYTD